VRLIPAADVKPFVRRNKTDARDAAAICLALQHPDLRLVRIKSVEQQACSLERSRALLVRQHTQLCNSVRGQLAAHGLVAAQGRRGFAELAALLAAGDDRLPAALLPVLRLLLEQIEHLAAGIAQLEQRIVAAARTDAAMRRLATIPGVGPIVAHAIVAAAGAGRQFRSARDFAAWAGLTPRAHSSAGKRRDKGISRQGDSRLRKLLALGASTLMRNARACPQRATAWQHGILARRPIKVAVLAQAAKTARIAWAVLTSGAAYQAHRQARPVKAAQA
jgi:transposase